jgi:hypothetical protein
MAHKVIGDMAEGTRGALDLLREKTGGLIDRLFGLYSRAVYREFPADGEQGRVIVCACSGLRMGCWVVFNADDEETEVDGTKESCMGF